MGGTGAVAVTTVGGVIRMCCSVGGQWYAIRGLWKAGPGRTGFTGGYQVMLTHKMLKLG